MRIKELLSENYDPDYGQYRGHPGDPRAPEPEEWEQEYDTNVEMFNELKNAVKTSTPLENIGVDTLEYLKTFDTEIQSLDSDSVIDIMYDVMHELSREIYEYEKNVERSQEPDY